MCKQAREKAVTAVTDLQILSFWYESLEQIWTVQIHCFLFQIIIFNLYIFND